jgi:hypothetical protein
MAIPLPERGQPVDTSLLYQIVNELNTLSAQQSTAKSKYFTIDTPNAGSQSTKTSDARVIGGWVDVVLGGSKTTGNQEPFSYTFPADFKYAPVVTATPVNVGGTDAGKNVSVVLKSITTSRVDGVVNFNTTGDLSVAVNLIIIGIPNS